METIISLLEELKSGVDFASRTDLVDSRVLDSLTILALVSDLEDAFDITIPAVEIVPQNFNSVAGILAMVVRLRESGF
ncbi:phosphopantetheine-binding protein [uncultured Enorma sp.]|jgi:D-alanine--poly(phosphoribitol) ligase subunit 2|uniref:phosphopantetheine-binding protein n=1 Tax=uncultured Enorma sp. TaxID=1714346 RepID=UPI0025E82A9D|nr:acyl carrier protein [uncultured Enorma sp.]